MAEKRMRRWPWVVVPIVVVATVVATIAAVHPALYGFLERFHPKHETIDLNKLFSKMPASAKPKAAFPPMTMLVFDYKQADAVLEAMKKELTPKRGFTSKANPSFAEREWEFYPGPIPKPGAMTIPKEASVFMSGKEASLVKEMYEGGGPAFITRLPSGRLAEPACFVLIVHEETWVEKSLSAVRRFLRL
jgi:hypothetical protein